MYAVAIIFSIYTVGQYSAARPLRISEVSSHAPKSLAVRWSSWNGRGLHGLWDLLWLALSNWNGRGLHRLWDLLWFALISWNAEVPMDSGTPSGDRKSVV